MKSKTYQRLGAVSAIALATFSSTASAAILYKDNAGTDINTLANWSTTNGAPTPDPLAFGSADQLRFNENTAASGTFTMDLSAGLSVGNLTVDSGTGNGGSATGNFVIDSANNSVLTLNGGGNPSYLTSGIVLNSGTGGTLTVNCDIVLGATPVRFTTSRALTVNGDISLGANTLEFNTAGSTTTLAGVISGTGGLNKAQGVATLALTNTANDFGGQVTLVGGTTLVAKLANIGGNSSFGTGNGASSIIMNGATLTYTGAGGDTTNRAIDMRAGAAINNNSGTGAISFTAANVIQGGSASARTLTLGGSNTGDNTFGSILGDSGSLPNITSLTKNGAGRWILTASNSYTGTTTVSLGTLVLGNATDTITNSGAVTINGGTLDIGSNTDTVGTVTLTTGNIIGTTGVLTGSSYAVSAGTISAKLGGSGALTKSNSGTVTLSGSNSYTGATTISAGTLSVGASGNLGDAASDLVFDGGTLQITGTALANFTGIGHTVLFNATKSIGLDIADAAHTFTVDQVLNQTTGGLTKLGQGTVVLNQNNTYTGTTFVNQGTLRVSGSGVLGGASGSVADANNIVFSTTNSSAKLEFETVANLGPASQIRFRNTGGTAGQGGALVYIGTTAQTLSKTIQCDTSIGIRIESNSVGGSLTFNGAFSQSNRGLYLGGTGTGDNTLATGFGGSGGLTKRDVGTWVLSAGNTYTGATSIDGGTLVLGASNVLANTAVSIGAATLAVGDGFSDTVGTLDPSAAATLNLGSGSTLAFAASNGIDWTGGTLTITGNFVSGASLRFGDSLSQPGLTPDQLLKISCSGFTGFGLNANGFLTASPVSGFSAWALANAPGQTIVQDHDGDGVKNGIEYFMGLSGNGFTANPAPDTSNVISWPKGGSYSGTYGIHYAIQTSSDLGINDDWTDVPLADVIIDGDSVDYDLDTLPAGDTKFARLKVTGP